MMTKTNPIIINLNSEIYSLDAIKRASYEYTDRCYILISQDNYGQISLSVTLKETAPNNTIQELMNAILDHQIRIDLEQEFGSLRAILVAQALSPTEDIKVIIEDLES